MSVKQNQLDVKQAAYPQSPAKPKEKVSKANLKYMRDKDREMVKGIFRFFEVPGGTMSFSFRKYKEDSIEKYTLVDGQVYTVPLAVAKHLNKNCWYPVHHYQQDEIGNKSVHIGKKVYRCGFQSLEFVDLDDIGDQSMHIVQDVLIK